MSIDPFNKPLSEMKRAGDPLTGFNDIATTYLTKKFSITEDKAKEIIELAIKEKGFKDPIVTYYKKDLDTLDKHKTTTRLSQYLATIESEHLTIAPSFTCYTKVDKDGNVWDSVHSKWTDVNKSKRNDFKKLAKVKKSEGKMTEFLINNTLQIAMKTKNNSLSGMYALRMYPQSTHSSHYSLTSTTRVITSTANSITESMLLGTRLYITPDDVLNHFSTLLTYTDFNKIQIAIDTYDLYIPTVSDIMDMVHYNTYYYWRSESDMNLIKEFVEKMSPVELVTILYTFDLYHIDKFNETTIRGLLIGMSQPISGICNDVNVLKNGREYILNLLHHIFKDDLVGVKLDYESYRGKPLADQFCSTYKNVESHLIKLQPLIEAFFQSEVLPVNVASLKDVCRRAISLSDTDSTVYSLAILVKRAYGRVSLAPELVSYAATLSLMVSETISSALSQLGINMNIDHDRVPTIEMKSEYFFNAIVPTSNSKHYFEGTEIVEKVISRDNSINFHGVSLINNKALKEYNDFKQSIADLIPTALNNDSQIDLLTVIDKIIEKEIEIIDRVHRGDPQILSYADIKDPQSYKQSKEKTPYYHYMLWDNVFSKKYGAVEEPPYVAVKINVTTDTANRLNSFVESIKDEDIKQRFKDFLKRYPKSGFKALQLPYDIISNNGIPEELIPILDVNRIVWNHLGPTYEILKNLGVGIRHLQLFKDYYKSWIESL